MTVASCPSCHESVMVPVDATSECIVRCPLCHEQFKLEAFLAQLPPALIVLDAKSTLADDEREVERSLDEDASRHARASLRVSDESAGDHDSVPAFDFIPGSVGSDGQERAIGTARRPGRRQKNTGVEVLKIVAGALLAIPAAQLILWWFVPGDWKRDLMGIGPPISRVVPWIVPQKFRAPTTESDFDVASGEGADAGEATVQRQRARSRPSNGSAIPLPGPGGQRDTPDRVSKEHDVDSTMPTRPQPTDVPADSASPPAAASQDSPADGGVQKFVQGVRGAPQYGASDLRTSLESAIQASIAWDTNLDQSEPSRAELTEQFYRAFARLGETVTYAVPTRDPAERDLVAAIQDVLLTFAQQPKKLAMIGNRSAQWLDQIDRPDQGVLLFGTVQQIRLAGQVFETRLELASLQERSVTVISRLDPKPFYQVNDRVLMLGAIVPDPTHNLRDYEGSEPMVVMGGLPTVLKP